MSSEEESASSAPGTEESWRPVMRPRSIDLQDFGQMTAKSQIWRLLNKQVWRQMHYTGASAAQCWAASKSTTTYTLSSVHQDLADLCLLASCKSRPPRVLRLWTRARHSFLASIYSLLTSPGSLGLRHHLLRTQVWWSSQPIRKMFKGGYRYRRSYSELLHLHTAWNTVL